MPVLTNFDAYRGQRAGAAVLDYARRFVINFGDFDANDDYYIPIEAGEVVLAVRAYAAATLTDGVTIDIGDGSAADGWLDSTGSNVTITAGSFANSMGLANAYSKGKVYASAAPIIVALGGNPSAGQLVVEVLFSGFDKGFERGVINPAVLS